MIVVDDFLQSISEDNPCGEYLGYDFIYDQIREHRREDDITLSQGIWQTDPKKANWAEVINICSNCLKTRTKDLQMAMWLLEALTATNGFDGLENGLLLVQSLCDKFWDHIHPRIGEDMSHRMAPFHFLAEKISERIVLIPLVQPADGISISYSLADWLIARRNLQIKDVKGLSLKQLKKSVVSTPLEFLEALGTRVTALTVKSKSLSDFLNGKSSADAPSFRDFFSILEDIEHIISKNMVDKKTQMANEAKKAVVESVMPDEDDEEEASEEAKDADEVMSIEKTYATLAELADFLEKAQPQSPAAMLLRIAAAVGRRSFRELLEMNINSGVSVERVISELHRALKAESTPGA
ncbi:MAG: type VI secretion system protein TssA [Holosporaceae bacterium]|jgi:type VI secretion system protein ImpA|nr:type VI secretion system protein TssA [Holosporaceae bacterium]